MHTCHYVLNLEVRVSTSNVRTHFSCDLDIPMEWMVVGIVCYKLVTTDYSSNPLAIVSGILGLDIHKYNRFPRNEAQITFSSKPAVWSWRCIRLIMVMMSTKW